ncbi:glycosyltransferase family 2 protein [Parabacteroides bouchesdurhonensis]|uniref:glycosyltransferase family 2 protein n=1 Tax=Parabacteroides bouchesdurhonensis TaxID=1936995 RepID=UPI000C84BB01|nr:glycosyltransferase family 2 protein [Parabacteroides bouchesdurhonensis]
MKNIRVTISIPIYNCSKTIERCLYSALSQTYENIEYVIVDDRGNDNSMEIVQYIAKQSSRLEDIKCVLHEKNFGLGAARNTGIRHATGDYIFFLDSDDTIPLNAIEYLVNQIQDEDYDMVAGSYNRIGQNGEIMDSWILPDKIFSSFEDCVIAFMKDKLYYVTNWGKLYKLELFKENNITFIQGCHQDTPCSFEIALNQKKIKLCSKIVYNWFYTEGSISTRVYKKKDYDAFEESFLLMKKIAQLYENDSLYPVILEYVNNYRLYPIWKLLSKDIDIENKSVLLHSFMFPLLSLGQLVRLKISSKEKLKHILFLFPDRFKLMLLRLVSYKERRRL